MRRARVMVISTRQRVARSISWTLLFAVLSVGLGVGLGCGDEDDVPDSTGDAATSRDAGASLDAMGPSDAGTPTDTGGAGDGSVETIPPGILVDPPSLAFGAVQVGTTRTLEAFIRNVGGAVLTVDVVRGSQLDDAFSFDSDSTAIPPGGVGVLQVAFAPVAVGEAAGTLEIRTNAPDRPRVLVELSGRGVTTGITVSPDIVDFGNVVVDTSATEAVIVTNGGDVGAEVELALGPSVGLCAVAEPLLDYCLRMQDRALDASGRFQLAARESANIEVRLTPRVAGVRVDGSFTLRWCPAPTCSAQVRLSGLGIMSSLRCRPNQLDFGTVSPGSAATLSLTCENVGNGSLTIVSWSITSGRGFEAEPARAQVLAPSDGFTVQVTFTPVGVGAFVGTLRLETDDPNLPTVDIPLAASGG